MKDVCRRVYHRYCHLGLFEECYYLDECVELEDDEKWFCKVHRKFDEKCNVCCFIMRGLKTWGNRFYYGDVEGFEKKKRRYYVIFVCGICEKKRRQRRDGHIRNPCCPHKKEKSFASHEMSENWSEWNDKKPRECSLNENNKYWFDCPNENCNHLYDCSLNNINVGRRCPYCANYKRCEDILNCDTCLKKTFYYHEMAVNWSSRNIKKPQDCALHQHKKYWFDCPNENCNHDYESLLNDSGCPYCSNLKRCKDILNCSICLKKTFKSHPMHIYWSKSNKHPPEYYPLYSIEKIKFDCPHCNTIYISTLNTISKGSWCPCTKNKTEGLLKPLLTDNYDKDTEHQYIIKELTNENDNNFKLDFYLPKYHLTFSCDGDHHFINERCPPKWREKLPLNISVQRDIHKIKHLVSNGYRVFRVYQPNILKNPNGEWRTAFNTFLSSNQKCMYFKNGKTYGSIIKYLNS